MLRLGLLLFVMFIWGVKIRMFFNMEIYIYVCILLI